MNASAASKFSGEYFAKLIYPAQLSGSDVASIHAWAYSTYGILNAGAANTELVISGNSIWQGIGVYGLQTIQRQAEPLFTKPVYISNQGVSGQTAQQVVGNLAYYQSEFRPGLGAHLFVSIDPTNDIDNLTSGSIVGAETTIFNNYVLPMIQGMQTPGYTVATPTVISRGWIGNSTDIAQKETVRLNFNALLLSSASTYGYTVLDFAAVPQSQNPSNTTYFNTDKIHPTAALDAYFAPILANWANPLLAANDNPNPNLYAANDNWAWSPRRAAGY